MYKISKKINEKWQNLGNIKKNQYDKLQLGLRCTPELKKMIADTADNGWLNLAVFPEDKERSDGTA